MHGSMGSFGLRLSAFGSKGPKVYMERSPVGSYLLRK